jgi:hypothetical protein
MSIASVSLLDAKNPGDLLSKPTHYFDFGLPVADVCVKTATREGLAGHRAVFVGGGGLVDNDAFQDGVDAARTCDAPVKVLWGAGTNRHAYPFQYAVNAGGLGFVVRQWQRRLGLKPVSAYLKKMEPQFPPQEFFASFDAVGLRDFNSGYTWLPCVSCMHPALDHYRNVAPRQALAIIEHPLFMRIDIPGVPKLANMGSSLEDMLAMIASVETLITSSYHAAYWATLMNRRVVVVPWATKFLCFRHRVETAYDLYFWKDHVARARSHPAALEECRNANRMFARLVGKLLGRPVAEKRPSFRAA